MKTLCHYKGCEIYIVTSTGMYYSSGRIYAKSASIKQLFEYIDQQK